VRVDGEQIDIAVASTWQTAPSSIPFAVGAMAGALAAFATWRRRATISTLLAAGGLIALTLGAVQYRSVPAETGPSLTLIALPLMALAVGAVFTRQPDARKAILPTDFSMPLDRGLSAFVAVLAIGCLLAAGTSFAHLMQGKSAN